MPDSAFRWWGVSKPRGLRIVYVNEWGPTAQQVAEWPALAEERERPMMLLMAVERS